MSKIMQALSKIIEKQKTVSDLIKLGEITIKNNGSHKLNINSTVTLETIFDNENTSISVVDYKDEGSDYPEHTHEGVIEYLICLKGSFGIKLPKNGYRILNPKECAKIPAFTTHTALSLEPNSQLLAICLPAEPGYIKTVKEEGGIICQKLQKKK